MHRPIRLLTAVPICDGHDSAINTLNIEFIHHGIEVVYLGFHRSVSDIARAAIQEDVAAVGISSYNGGHVEFFRDVRQDLDRRGGKHIGLFGGGGGTISEADARRMRRQGTDEIFFAGTPLETILRFVRKKLQQIAAVAALLAPAGFGPGGWLHRAREVQARRPSSTNSCCVISTRSPAAAWLSCPTTPA